MKKIRILFFISIMMLLCLFISACSRNTIHKEVKFSATVALNKVEIQETKSNTINRDDQRKERIINAQIKMYEMFSDKASGNYVISPLSIYMAFSLLHEIGSANVKKELEDSFNLTSADYEFAGEVFKNMVFESYKDESSNLLSCLQLSNTIWLDSSIKANSEPLDRLAKIYYCYAFNTDFQKHNAKANKDIREFIKSKTNGLIDKDFNIDSDTLFALINTVYLKDLWNYYGDDLPKEKRNFNYTGKEELINFLMGSYTNGQAAKSEIAQTFYTNSRMFKINFVVAGENHTLKEAMAYDNLNYLRNNQCCV